MSLNIKTATGLQKVAGSTLLSNLAVSDTRTGTFTVAATTGKALSSDNTIIFSTPMPDDQYLVMFESGDSTGGYMASNIWGKTVNGFKVSFSNENTNNQPATLVKYTAFKLVTETNLNNVINKVNNPDSTPTEDSENLVTSGGVYEALEGAGKNFIGTSQSWNNLSTEEKLTYKSVDFIDSDSNIGVTISDTVAEGDLNPVTSNAVYNALNSNIVYKTQTFETVSQSLANGGQIIVDFPMTAGKFYIGNIIFNNLPTDYSLSLNYNDYSGNNEYRESSNKAAKARLGLSSNAFSSTLHIAVSNYTGNTVTVPALKIFVNVLEITK